MATITFGPNAKRESVTDHALKVLNEILDAVGIGSATISSTARGAADQARIMFENLSAHGAVAQHRLYGPNGDKVIDLFEEGRSLGWDRPSIISAMTKKIIELGPGNVSHHCADPSKLCVFDVAPSSIPKLKQPAFSAAVHADKRVAKFFEPPDDPGFHMEIPA